MVVDLAILCLDMETAPADGQMGQHLQMARYEENKLYLSYVV